LGTSALEEEANMSRSYHDKILRIDLTTRTVEVERPGPTYWRRYMGGWNIIGDVLLKEVPPGVDPLGPENVLIFAPGLLTGLPISGASRSAVGAKSPLTGAFGAAEVGGNWGAQFKRAGYDALIVSGTSPTPIYLWITDGEVEIRDATGLWGKTTKETQAAIRAELDAPRAELAMIGPGGENQVRYACLMNGLVDAAGRTGMGAVMGAKRLKAVAALGTPALGSVDPEAIRTLARDMASAVNAGEKGGSLHRYGTGVGIEAGVISGNLPIHNFREGVFPGAAKLSADNFMEEIGVGMSGCWACAVRCKKAVEAKELYALDPDYGGPEYESFGALGSCCGVDDIVVVSKATELCNAYALDTISCGVTIAFAMECYENGLLTEKDTDGIELRFGNGEAVVQMVERIARREGIGDLLAEGTRRAAAQIGGNAWQYAMQVKGQEYPMHEPRLKPGLGIGYAVSPTGADHNHSMHDVSMTGLNEDGFQADALAREMGVLEALSLGSLGPEKVRAFFANTVHKVSRNCLCMCAFVPWTMAERMEMLRAATGWDVNAYEYLQLGQRALTLARAFNVREGFGPADDRLALRSYGPTRSGALAEGGLDPEALEEAVHAYYAMMGWDKETGVPTVERLYQLGIGWAAAYLPALSPP
jgi:aldehyde:ferredoxin oxidoreductase